MPAQKVLIIGSSGHAKVIVDIFEKSGQYEIVGFVDSFRESGEETAGYKVLGKEADLPELLQEHPGCFLFIAIGDNGIRQKVKDKITALVPEAQFATAIHPSAQIARDVQIGHGSAVMAGVVINSETTLGNFTILNTKSSIDHESEMADYSSLAPGVTTGACVTIGTLSAVLIGSTIKRGITIGNYSVISEGSLVLENCGDYALMSGVPAVEVRKREKEERYL
ncbi:MAG: transferase [Bacteroidetes bacterium]|nr:transferase [Bacteroidota bacterium]